MSRKKKRNGVLYASNRPCLVSQICTLASRSLAHTHSTHPLPPTKYAHYIEHGRAIYIYSVIILHLLFFCLLFILCLHIRAFSTEKDFRFSLEKSLGAKSCICAGCSSVIWMNCRDGRRRLRSLNWVIDAWQNIRLFGNIFWKHLNRNVHLIDGAQRIHQSKAAARMCRRLSKSKVARKYSAKYFFKKTTLWAKTKLEESQTTDGNQTLCVCKPSEWWSVLGWMEHFFDERNRNRSAT